MAGGGRGKQFRKEAMKSRRNGWGRGNIVKRKLWRVEGMAGGRGKQCGKEAVKSRRNGWRGRSGGNSTGRKGSC